MTEDSKEEILQRLKTAFKRAKEIYEANPIPRDLHEGTIIANHWLLMTATYSGLEQTLKFLIAIENSQSIQDYLKDKSNYIHDLSNLYGQLGNETKQLLEDHYIQFQSIHYYIPMKDIGKFLSHVSGNKGIGYQLWRYSLIEHYNQPPVNSVDAMITIWGLAVEICAYRIYQKFKPRLPAQKIQFKLKQSFTKAYMNVAIFDQNNGKPYPNLEKEIKLLYQRFDCPLNLFTKILWNYDRFETHGLDNVSEKLSEVINEWAGLVLENPKHYIDSTLKVFLGRSTGRTIIGESIRWNSHSGKFENVPWSLDCRSMESKPKNAVKVRNNTENEIKRLRIILYKNGFLIKENLFSYCSDVPGKNLYYCIMEVLEKGSQEPVFSLWQLKKYSERIFYFMEEKDIETPIPEIERWINDKKRKQDMERELGLYP